MKSKKGSPPKPYRSWFEYELSKQLKGTGAKYEKLVLPYCKLHTYKPDWVLPNGIIIEAKGRFTSPDRAKHLLIKKQHPQLDIRFVFLYDNKLYKTSKTRYSAWCESNGYKYNFVIIPKKWIEEPSKKIIVNNLIEAVST